MYQNGMGRGRGHKNNKNDPRTGPLLTDHLQVGGLERELEMLRHNMEVVQREQEMATFMDRKRQYEHINHEVSNMYGNVRQQPPPNRAPLQTSSWMDTTQDSVPNTYESLPANYIPSLMCKKFNPPGFSSPIKPIGHPMLKNTVTQRFDRPTNVRKDFRPTNIIKKRIQKNSPNKLNTYPVKERKNLVSKATGSQSTKYTNKPPEDSENLVLRDNQTLNSQVSGRLEVALGSIVKEIRSSNIDNEKFKTLIANPKHLRIMKQAVRERIRTVMLNKTVGSVIDIVTKYRQKFPKASDKDIVELVINSEHENVIETDNPEEFFKKNIASILEKKIQEMAMELLKMYERRARINMRTANDTNKKPVVKESVLDSEMSMKVIRGLTGKYVTVEEKNVLTKYYTELIENILEEKIPEYLPKCADQFLKIFNLDHQFKTIKRMATERVRNEVEGSKTEDKDLPEQQDEQEQSTETSDMEENDVCDSKETTTEIDEVNETTEITPVPMDMEESTSIPKASNSQQQKSSKKIVPSSLEKNAESCESIKPTTPLAKKTGTGDTVTTKTPLAKTLESTSTTVNSPVTPSAKELPYYVKLIGQPKLPNRADICDFLNKYKPNSIKKHKSINNLLVVGFVNQEDYDKILLANETVIGDITIIIKAREKVIAGKENESINEGNNSKIDTQDDSNANNETRSQRYLEDDFDERRSADSATDVEHENKINVDKGHRTPDLQPRKTSAPDVQQTYRDDISHCDEVNSAFTEPEVQKVSKKLTGARRKRYKILINHNVPHEEALEMCQKRWNQLPPNSNPEQLKRMERMERRRKGMAIKRIPQDKPTQDKPTQYKPTQDKPAQDKTYFLKGQKKSEVRIEGVTHMTEKQTDILRHYIISKILQLPKSEGPRFEDYGYKSGVLLVNCRDKQSQKWLQQIVSQIEPWPGAKLNAAIVPVRYRPIVLHVTLPETEIADAGHAFSLFKIQNRGLNTEDWVLLASKPVRGGLLITVSVDRRSAEVLQEANYKACVGFKTIRFKKLS